jgi:hypothetical protein
MEWTWTEAADINDLREKLIVFAQHRHYEARKIGKDMLDISRSSTIRQIFGLTSGVRLIVRVTPGRTTVQLDGHWKEFAMKLVGLIGLAIPIFFPIVITAAWGAYTQNRLMDDLKKEIDEYFDSVV